MNSAQEVVPHRHGGWSSPLRLALAGWILLPAMYVLAGTLHALGIATETALLISSALGLTAVLAWGLALVQCGRCVHWQERPVATLLAALLVILALGSASFGYWIAANGGV